MARNILPSKKIVYRCSKCGLENNVATNFYRCRSREFFNNNGYLPICKDCLAELYNSFLIRYHDIRKAIKRICMAYDIYYSDTIIEQIVRDESAPHLGEYFKQLNLTQHKGKTFENTIREGFVFDSEFSAVELEAEEERKRIIASTPQSVINRWGTGFTKDEYDTLEAHYKYLKKANPNCDENQEIFINDLCLIKMQQMNAVHGKNTDDFNKLSESYRRTFTQAGLKTTKEQTNEDEFSYGVNIQTIEQYTPAEYYKNKDRNKDIDGMADYVKRFIYRPLKNLMQGTDERDVEYYVKDEEEDVVDDE